MTTIERLCLIGAGTMGHGIAYVALAAGRRVAITDADAATLAGGVARIRAAFEKGIERGKVTTEQRDAAMARLTDHASIRDAVSEAELVVEAVPERMDLKRSIFGEVERHVGPDTILASNTSSLSITQIASAVERPQRVIGMHFFNPVPAMRLVELVRGEHTSDQTVEVSRRFSDSLGKTPIVVRDTPGFATSRLGVVLGLEAVRMLEQGVASAQDID
ncbi:MAG: 3-hydroxyacyl-CoA dehydrogenase family protein, partial [Gemmatimonadaceae bacterium]